MKNEEKILRYLSDLMSKEEKELFLKDLDKSDELKNLLRNIQHNLDKVKEFGKVDVNQTYFANLLPNVRAKLGSKKKFNLLFKPAYVTVIIILVIVSMNILFTNNSETNYYNSLKEYLTDVEDEYIANAIDESSFTNNYDNYVYDEVVDDYFEQIEINSGDLDGYFDKDLYSEYSMVNELSSEEVEEIYNTLLKTKIL